MDNFHVDITSDRNLEEVLKIIFSRHKVYFWKATYTKFLLAWHTPRESDLWTEAPFPMDHTDMTPIIQGWLNKSANYPREPDHDGHNGQGWRVFNEDWGMVDGDHSVFAAIEPVWAMYGK